MRYLAPVGVLVSGAFFPVPIAVLLYFLATNVWTFGQQHVLGDVVEREAAGVGRARRGTPPDRRGR